MAENIAYVVDFGRDKGMAEDFTDQCDALGLSYRLTPANRLILAEAAVEVLRKQPEDAHASVANDEDNVPNAWIFGYCYPIVPVH